MDERFHQTFQPHIDALHARLDLDGFPLQFQAGWSDLFGIMWTAEVKSEQVNGFGFIFAIMFDTPFDVGDAEFESIVESVPNHAFLKGVKILPHHDGTDLRPFTQDNKTGEWPNDIFAFALQGLRKAGYLQTIQIHYNAVYDASFNDFYNFIQLTKALSHIAGAEGIDTISRERIGSTIEELAAQRKFKLSAESGSAHPSGLAEKPKEISEHHAF